MEFNELIKERYSARAYKDEKIDEKKIDAILEMIRLSPSAVNLQPWKIKVISDNEIKEKLYENSKYQKHITECSHVLIFCADPDLPGLGKKLIDNMKTIGVPEEGIKVYEMGLNSIMSEVPPEGMLSEAQKNVFIAAAYGSLAAKSLGIDSCIIQGFNPFAYSEILQLPSGLVPTLLLVLGYAADQPTPKLRFSKEDIFI